MADQVSLAQDVRYAPAYSLSDVAQHLRLAPATLRTWIYGRTTRTTAGTQWQEPLIVPPQTMPDAPALLSLVNVVEVHVLQGLRQCYRLSWPTIRTGLQYLTVHFGSQHPLAEYTFLTDGRHLFIDRYGCLINLSKDGQLAMREVLENSLARLERQPPSLSGPQSTRLQPHNTALQSLMHDPWLTGGRAVSAGTGVAVAVI